jgi:hypothetical protein
MLPPVVELPVELLVERMCCFVILLYRRIDTSAQKLSHRAFQVNRTTAPAWASNKFANYFLNFSRAVERA